jgi:uncharacterized protein (DUF885 family)
MLIYISKEHSQIFIHLLHNHCMKKLIFLSLSTGFLFAACNNRSASDDPNKVFTSWKENAFMDSMWHLSPEAASVQGYHKYDSLLNVPDSATSARTLAFAEHIEAVLHSYPYESLTDLNKTDYKLIENYVTSTLFYTNDFKENEWNPALYNIGDAIDYVINNNPAQLEEKLRNLTSRLSKVPAYYAAAEHNIHKPTKEHTSLAIDQGDGLLFFFDKVFPDSLKASKLTDTEKEAFNKSATAAREAVVAYSNWLKELQKGFTADNTRSFAIGKELYAKKFACDIQCGISADDMYQKALARKAAIHQEMYQITVQLWPTYMGSKDMPKDTLIAIKQLIDKLSEKHCNRDSFMSTIEHQLPELVQFINDKKLITLDPSKPLKVRKTPDYMAGVAGASINNPGPYDKNGNTYYNVTPLTGYSAEKAESYLREYNDYVLQILDIHEAIPGHYVQLIYANRSPSIIKSVFGNGAMIEGWACYAERMMIEAGYHKSPEMQLFYDKWNLREACNFLLDYNIQANGWNESQVMDLLVKEGFQQSAEAHEKYKRATLSQVQLASYFSGQTEIFELRDEMKKKLGDKFDLKAFHEQFLSYGSAPVKEIRTLMLK